MVGDIGDFTPPFADPLIDEVIFEFNRTAVIFYERLSVAPQELNQTGLHNRITMVVFEVVHCAEGWNGTNCEIFCNQSTGMCNQGIYDLRIQHFYSPSIRMGMKLLSPIDITTEKGMTQELLK